MIRGRGTCSCYVFILSRADINAITQIKVSPHRADDILAWAPAANGIFTVKSAYWLGMDELNRGIEGAMTHEQGTEWPEGHLVGALGVPCP
jgi:hypothetical protein